MLIAAGRRDGDGMRQSHRPRQRLRKARVDPAAEEGLATCKERRPPGLAPRIACNRCGARAGRGGGRWRRTCCRAGRAVSRACRAPESSGAHVVLAAAYCLQLGQASERVSISIASTPHGRCACVEAGTAVVLSRPVVTTRDGRPVRMARAESTLAETRRAGHPGRPTTTSS